MRGSECHIVQTPQGGYSTQATLGNTPVSLLLLSDSRGCRVVLQKRKRTPSKDNGLLFQYGDKFSFPERKIFLENKIIFKKQVEKTRGLLGPCVTVDPPGGWRFSIWS